MTVEEFRERLEAEPDDEKVRGIAGHFPACRGMGEPLRANFVRFYADHPEWERLLCFYLKMPTEDDKRTRAAMQAAEATAESAAAAKRSAVAAWIAAAIALAAFLASLLPRFLCR